MPDLLLELRSEEIPARMQRHAAADLRKMLTDGLVERGLTYEAAREYFTPRRLTLDVRGVSARSRDVAEERKGPSTKAPEQAVQGFLRSAGLATIADAHIHSDPKKGDFYVARTVKPGRTAEAIVADLVPAVVRSFPWPKSMRWGPASAQPGSLRWVRPLQSIVCTFGPETGEPEIVDFEVDGIRSGNVTYGHRFHAPGAITVRRFEDYAAKLDAAKVVVDSDRRKAMILDDAKNLAFAAGLELVEDENLLEEVAGLVEWPVVLMGSFDEEFLTIPPEVIRLTIRANQKCFVTLPSTSPSWGGRAQAAGGAILDAVSPPPLAPPHNPDGVLAPRFILTANIEAADGGAEIARGNGKVVRARLSDALYFWTTDQRDLPDLERLQGSAEKFGLELKKPLDQRMARLDHLGVTFHAKLGTQGERVERIARLAEELAPVVGADPALARRAAVLAKADLTTEIVGEFPELQGAMGRKYALLQGEHPSVAVAIEAHYKPQGPSDRVPTDPVSIAVALADKLDTLVGFWAIDEKPTGSKDPFALRRAALGVIRILVENGVAIGLRGFISTASGALTRGTLSAFVDDQSWQADLLSFFHERLKVYLRDQGARHDLIGAVLAAASSRPISPLVGEMSAKPAEGGAVPQPSQPYDVERGRSTLRPSALPGISPTRGEIGAPAGGRGPDRASAGQASPTEDPAQRTAASGGNDDLLSIVRRVAALGTFLATDDGKNLLAGTKRAANILAAEAKKGTPVAARVEPALFRLPAEQALCSAVDRAESQAAAAMASEEFPAALSALSALREPVDAFFEKVLVNDEDIAVRANRLALLARIKAATDPIADFSQIAG